MTAQPAATSSAARSRSDGEGARPVERVRDEHAALGGAGRRGDGRRVGLEPDRTAIVPPAAAVDRVVPEHVIDDVERIRLDRHVPRPDDPEGGAGVAPVDHLRLVGAGQGSELAVGAARLVLDRRERDPEVQAVEPAGAGGGPLARGRADAGGRGEIDAVGPPRLEIAVLAGDDAGLGALAAERVRFDAGEPAGGILAAEV